MGWSSAWSTKRCSVKGSHFHVTRCQTPLSVLLSSCPLGEQLSVGFCSVLQTLSWWFSGSSDFSCHHGNLYRLYSSLFVFSNLSSTSSLPDLQSLLLYHHETSICQKTSFSEIELAPISTDSFVLQAPSSGKSANYRLFFSSSMWYVLTSEFHHSSAYMGWVTFGSYRSSTANCVKSECLVVTLEPLPCLMNLLWLLPSSKQCTPSIQLDQPYVPW